MSEWLGEWWHCQLQCGPGVVSLEKTQKKQGLPNSPALFPPLPKTCRQEVPTLTLSALSTEHPPAWQCQVCPSMD